MLNGRANPPLEIEARLKEDIIIEAEMVAYSDTLSHIDGTTALMTPATVLTAVVYRVLAHSKSHCEHCDGCASQDASAGATFRS